MSPLVLWTVYKSQEQSSRGTRLQVKLGFALLLKSIKVDMNYCQCVELVGTTLLKERLNDDDDNTNQEAFWLQNEGLALVSSEVPKSFSQHQQHWASASVGDGSTFLFADQGKDVD